MSFKNEYTLNVDIKRRMTSVVPTFKQGDSATLKFKIFDDGKKFDLAAFTRAEITFKLPSGQTIVGEPYIDVNTQMIVYNFVGVEMNEAGKLTSILSIYSGTSMVSIQPFSIFIFDHLKDKDLSYIGILQDLIAEVQLLNEEVKSTLSEANNLKDKLNDVLNEANNAEQIRNTNEQNRITSENTRNSNENIRQQNELDRKNAESIRESNEATRIQNEQNRQNEFDNKINEAEVAITDTKNATDEANKAADSIKGWGQATVWNSTTTYSKNNVVTYNGSTWQSKGDNNHNSIPSETNTNWILLALRGVDGTGAVSTVNGKSPDGAGNVELTADEIGTYTQQQIDDKDTTVKEYFTDKGIGDKVIVISEQDYIDANYNGMFWVKNDALDFLPTETDHVATLLVYENPDNENVVKIFNVINPTTAISYMRTYTFDNASSLIHDSGWIEGGGGSGTGGGNVNVNSYPLVTDTVSQTIWELPTGTYNQVTDSVMVFHNTVFLEPVSYTITHNRLSIPYNPHTEIAKNNVVLVVFRNMPNMTVQFDGNNIIDGSITLEKLGRDVQDAILAGGNSYVTIIDDKVFIEHIKSAKSGRFLTLVDENTNEFPPSIGSYHCIVEFSSSIVDGTIMYELQATNLITNKRYSRSIWFSESDTSYVILDPGWQEIGNDLVDNLTTNDNTKALAASVGSKINTELGKKIGVNFNNNNSVITNLGGAFAKKTFPIVNFANNTTSEKVRLTLGPLVSGILKLTMTSNWNNSNASGGCIVYYHVNVADGNVHFKDTNIVSMSSAFAENFYISDIYIDRFENFYIDIFKRKYLNPLSIVAEYQTTWGNPFAVLNDTILEQFDLGMVINDPIQQSIFTHVGNSKQGLASAITGKGVPTDANATFAQMINNINSINANSKVTGTAWGGVNPVTPEYVNGTASSTLVFPMDITFLNFVPFMIFAYNYNLLTGVAEIIIWANGDPFSGQPSVKVTTYNDNMITSASYNYKSPNVGAGNYRLFVPKTGVPYTYVIFGY
ncbi:hypothetical protein C3943_08095 [Lysinibacillus sp. B2A1]|nr:hypothetical protein C3943_08095 [Lysinibacillus sp. B2A1]